MIPARVRTLLGVLLLAVASPAQKGGDMPQLIDKVMLQAAERYANMASGLEKGKMPRTFSGGRLVQADIVRQRIPPYRRHGLPRCIAQGGRHSCGTL